MTNSEHGLIIDFNGNYQPSNSLDINNIRRALVFGDCVFEQIRTNASTMLFFGRHLDKLCAAMTFMNMDIPKKFASERTVLKEELTKLLIKNKIFKGGLVTLLVSRADGGDSWHQPSQVHYIAMVKRLPSVLFELNTEGLSLNIYNEMPMPPGRVANFNTHLGSVVKSLAVQYALNKFTSDSLIVNANGGIIGAATYGNIFCVKDSVVYTPPLSEGCHDSVIRRHVLDVAEILGIQTDANTIINAEFLTVADEIFLASTEYGLKWVIAWQNRRYYRRTAETIWKRLNEYYADEF